MKKSPYLLSMVMLCSPIYAFELQLGNLDLFKDHHMPHDRYSSITLCGDIASLGLPAIGVIASLYDTKPETFHKASMITAGVLVSTGLLKRTFDYTHLGERPNGHRKSFPSGHTSSAFLGARLIHKQFGWEYGAAAYGLATLTAYSRVDGHYHHVRDVAAGATLALIVDYAIDHEWFEYKHNHFSLSVYPLYMSKKNLAFSAAIEF